MIKSAIKIITLASLTVGLGFDFIPKNSFSLPSPEIKSTKVQNNSLPVALPYRATVTFKEDNRIKTVQKKYYKLKQSKYKNINNMCVLFMKQK